MSAPPNDPQFVTIVLGATGGPREENLSAYLLAPVGSSDFIALDAGTLLTGIRQAEVKGSFGDGAVPQDSPLAPEGWILQHRIVAYLISHAHLDHVAGLILNSQDDTAKKIIGLGCTIDALRDHLFNGRIWPNFGTEGAGHQLRQYQYQRVVPGQEYRVCGTSLSVEPFVLSHAAHCPSTAFLIQIQWVLHAVFWRYRT
jgi:cAMP phosphodiesterase